MIDNTSLTTLVASVIATELKVTQQMVIDAVSLRRDLKMDSIAVVNVAFALEDALGIELDVARDQSFDSIESIVEALQRAIGMGRRGA